jgi:hypothetical protein
VNREEFEQLVSRWLDEPQREDLKAAVERAVAGSDELARLRDQWQRLGELIRAAALEPAGVDWQRLRRRILSALRESAAPGVPAVEEESLDRALAMLPAVEPRVDWEKLRHRIMARVAAERSARDRQDILRPVLRPWVVGLGLAAAAAVLVMTVLPRPGAMDGREGVARVWVGGPPASRSPGYAIVRFHTPQDVLMPVEPLAPPEAELFLMIEPPPARSAPPAGLAFVMPLTD